METQIKQNRTELSALHVIKYHVTVLNGCVCVHVCACTCALDRDIKPN